MSLLLIASQHKILIAETAVSQAYWEPAKWVAKLRELKTNPEVPLFLKTDMSTGHFSASDRYKYLRETAIEYSFLIDQICPGK